MIGFICINKNVGDTSSYCVNKVKKVLKERCGHMGTLDPLASGVLPIGIGQASRMFDYLLDKKKTYLARFDFNFTTPTLDMESEPIAHSNRVITREELQSVIPQFLGEVDQVPPIYSSIMVAGERSYRLAREGVEVELKSKKITIDNITILDQIDKSVFDLRIDCRGGTYIRSIVRDMAKLLGVCGTMVSLMREKSGVFELSNSITIEELLSTDNFYDKIIPADSVVDYPKISFNDNDYTRILNGLTNGYDIANGLYRGYNNDGFFGIVKVEDKNIKVTYIRDL